MCGPCGLEWVDPDKNFRDPVRGLKFLWEQSLSNNQEQWTGALSMYRREAIGAQLAPELQRPLTRGPR